MYITSFFLWTLNTFQNLFKESHWILYIFSHLCFVFLQCFNFFYYWPLLFVFLIVFPTRPHTHTHTPTRTHTHTHVPAHAHIFKPTALLRASYTHTETDTHTDKQTLTNTHTIVFHASVYFCCVTPTPTTSRPRRSTGDC